MKYIITESQQEKIKTVIQDLIDGALDEVRNSSEEWGMEDYYEVESIDKIVIKDIHIGKRIVVDVNIHVNTNRFDFDNVMSYVEDYVKSWIPNVEFSAYEIIDERTWGPGIDW